MNVICVLDYFIGLGCKRGSLETVVFSVYTLRGCCTPVAAGPLPALVGFQVGVGKGVTSGASLGF